MDQNRKTTIGRDVLPWVQSRADAKSREAWYKSMRESRKKEIDLIRANMFISKRPSVPISRKDMLTALSRSMGIQGVAYIEDLALYNVCRAFERIKHTGDEFRYNTLTDLAEDLSSNYGCGDKDRIRNILSPPHTNRFWIKLPSNVKVNRLTTINGRLGARRKHTKRKPSSKSLSARKREAVQKGGRSEDAYGGILDSGILDKGLSKDKSTDPVSTVSTSPVEVLSVFDDMVTIELGGRYTITLTEIKEAEHPAELGVVITDNRR